MVNHDEKAGGAAFWYKDGTEIKAYDDWLLQSIHNSVGPLQLEPYDLQAIHRRFELCTDCFPPDADGSNQIVVDAGTWQNYCGLNFSRFPLHLIVDDDDTADSVTVAAAETLAAGVEQAAAIKKADHEASKKADAVARISPRNTEIKAGENAAAAETAVGVEKVGPNVLDAEIEVYDNGLLHYIWDSVRPLQLNRDDLQSIHRQFELYTENFPPDASGRVQNLVDAETWQTYCELQFSQFPLYFVEDENETACS